MIDGIRVVLLFAESMTLFVIDRRGWAMGDRRVMTAGIDGASGSGERWFAFWVHYVLSLRNRELVL